MGSNGSNALTVLAVLGSLVAVVGGTNVLCDQNHTRPIGSTIYCGSEDAFLCQAVLDASLSVKCWRCPDGIAVNWKVTYYSSGQQVELKTIDKTLKLTTSEVIKEAAGCYQCKCEQAGEPFGVNFSVTVAPGAKPKFTVQVHQDSDNNIYKLSPEVQVVTLNASVSGETVVNCSATGYPDPTYSWQVDGKDINDSCIRVEDGGKQLTFVPTQWNTKNKKTYQFSCTVQNGLLDGTIIGEQMILFKDVKEWLLHPHPAQSGRVMYLTDGTATGVVAASDYSKHGIEYLICGNMPAVTPKDHPACKVKWYMEEGKCCPCTASPCHVGLDLRMSESEVPDNQGLGLDASGCNFTTSTQQRLLFFARRHLGPAPTYAYANAYQLIGITDVENAPLPATGPDGTVIGGSVGGVVGVGIFFAVVVAIIIIIIVHGVKKRRHHVLAVENSTTHADHTPPSNTVYYEAGEIAIPTTPAPHGTVYPIVPATDAPSVTVQAGRDEPRDLPCAARGTSANAFECTIPDLVIEAGKDYRLVVYCDNVNWTVNLSFAAAKCSSLRNQVRRLHDILVRGLHLDRQLSSQLHQRQLVTKKEFDAINTYHEMHNSPAAGPYFVNSVLFQWPLQAFEGNVSQLAEALESHDDIGNKKIASKLHQAYSESELNPDVPLISPNPRITPGMPSVIVHAGPDEYPLQLQDIATDHPTMPNTFECVVPEQIRFEAENEYRIVVNCNNQSVIVSFTVAKCSCTECCGGLTDSGIRGEALFEQVRQKQSELTAGLLLDGTLLGQLREHQLVTRVEFSAINAHILGHNKPEAGMHFVNLVLFGWPFEVFESNIRRLVKALQSHGDSGNQRVATALCEAFSKCGLDVHATCMS